MDAPTLPPERFFLDAQLELARAIHRGDLAAVRALAPRTDLRTPGAQRSTLAYYALHESLSRDPARVAVLRELVACAPDTVQQQVAAGGTLLEACLASEHPDFLEALLDAGVSPDARAHDGTAPAIVMAALDGSIGNVRLLLDRGAQVDARNELGETALMMALAAAQLDIVDLLIERGADVRVVNRLGVSFPHLLSVVLDSEREDSPLHPRLVALRTRIGWDERLWPPPSPLAERDAMRARGEVPIVPASHAR